MMPLGSRRLSSEGSPETLRSRQSRFRSPWSCSLLTLSVAVSGLVCLLFILHAFLHRPVGDDGCDVPLMSPTYIRMVEFDAEHTRFASKYNLFLYREEGVDPYTQENIGVCLTAICCFGFYC
jgi:glycosylphosphatidylinositol deacylase